MSTDDVEEAKQLFLSIREYATYGYAKSVDMRKLEPGAQRLLAASIVKEMEVILGHAAKMEQLLFKISSGSCEPLEKRKQITTSIKEV